MRQRAILALVVLSLGWAWNSSAWAMSPTKPGEPEPFGFGSSPQWYLLSGVTAGGTLLGAGPGGFVGVDMSVVRLQQGFWVGGYVDAFYEFADEAPTLTLGPEVGFWFVGVDAGVATRGVDGEVELGASGRLNLAAGLVSVFGRYMWWPEDPQGEHTIQIGVTMKLPVWASSQE